MFSFFASKSRQYEIDRFVNLWAAMNSYYSYINKCYEKCLKEKYKVSDEIYAIRTINYFLDRFLNDAIPEMFSDRFWNEKKQNWMEEFICHIKSEKESKKYFELLSRYKSTSEMTDFSLE